MDGKIPGDLESTESAALSPLAAAMIRIPELLTAKPIAKQLNASTSRIYQLVRANQIPHVRLGSRQIRFDPRKIADWIEAGGTVR
jgi:excisionase family DNA binding protein